MSITVDWQSSVQVISDNLISISQDEALAADPSAILDGGTLTLGDGTKYHRFRQNIFMRDGITPAQLSHSDVAYLGQEGDGDQEHKKNRRFKRLLGGVLSKHFNEQAIHVYEFGCGKHPIAGHIEAMGEENNTHVDLTYHGIDVDTSCIDAVQDKGLAASGWDEAMEKGMATSVPSICVSVYALHFLTNDDLPSRILTLAGDNGFFAGNFYAHGDDNQQSRQRTQLADIIDNHNTEHGDSEKLSYSVLRAGGDETWFIYRPQNAAMVEGVMSDMEEEYESRGKTVTRNPPLSAQPGFR